VLGLRSSCEGATGKDELNPPAMSPASHFYEANAKRLELVMS